MIRALKRLLKWFAIILLSLWIGLALLSTLSPDGLVGPESPSLGKFGSTLVIIPYAIVSGIGEAFSDGMRTPEKSIGTSDYTCGDVAYPA